MENQLKLLLSEEDLHNLKKVSIELQSYQTNILKPLRDTLANEARRAINYNRKVETTIKEGERILVMIQYLLGDRV